MTYNEIDEQLKKWAKNHHLTLFTEFDGKEARFFYTSSARGETFQVSIEAPVNNYVRIDAWSTETINDEELHEEWMASVKNLDVQLSRALAQVNTWETRNNRKKC